MRSRYTAFVQQRWDYLLGTWHPSTRPTAPLESEPGVRWLGLEVRSRTVPSGEPLQGWVEFVARSKWGGRAQRLHERSRFLWEVGQWWYVDGQIR